MADTLRIKRRATGSPGAPASLANAEIAYNEVDHTLYYGEGTGGAGGTASVIVAVGGPGLASSTTPIMDGAGATGTGTTWARADHQHPSDTTKANLANPTFTGTVTVASLTATGTLSGAGFTNLLAPYAPLNSPVFTGTPSLPAGATGVTQTLGTNNTTFATTAFVAAAAAAAGVTSWNTRTGAVVFTAADITGVGGALLASPTFTGTVTISGTITGTGMTSWAASPPPIGSTAPSSGAFTTLSASSTVSGVGFTTWAAAPPPIGSTTANSGAFTSLSATGTVSGAGFTNLLAPYAPLNSPTFTGTPSLPAGTTGFTQTNGTNNTTFATTAYVLATRLDQLQAPTANVSFNSRNITNLLDPVNPQDGATKNYVDGVAQGLDAKPPCLVATTGVNITLSGTQTIDGVGVVAGNRVLVKDQTTAAQNGIYVVATGAWTRATDMNLWAEVPAAFTFIEEGGVNADTGWLCTSDPGGTLGTTPVTWVQFSAAGVITAGNGLQKVGNVISAVGTAGQIAVGAAIAIDPAYVGQTSITTLGNVATGTWNATTIAVNKGGTGAVTLTGYVIGNGTSAMTASATIPNTNITGLGTMSTQNATAVAITGGTIDGVTFDMGSF